MGAAIGAGLRYIRVSPHLLRVLLRTAIFNLAGVVVLALLPLVARDTLKGTALTYGMMLGTFGFGAIGGGLANAAIVRKFNNEVVIRATFANFALALILLGASTSMPLSCIALLVAGACWVISLSLFNVTVQLSRHGGWLEERSPSIRPRLSAGWPLYPGFGAKLQVHTVFRSPSWRQGP